MQLGSFAGDLENVLCLGCKGDNGIDDRGGFAERAGVRANFFLPRLAVQCESHLWANKGMRLLVRKIRRAVFYGIDFHFLARLDLDERFRGSAVLAVGFEPYGPAQDASDRHPAGRRRPGLASSAAARPLYECRPFRNFLCARKLPANGCATSALFRSAPFEPETSARCVSVMV